MRLQSDKRLLVAAALLCLIATGNLWAIDLTESRIHSTMDRVMASSRYSPGAVNASGSETFDDDEWPGTSAGKPSAPSAVDEFEEEGKKSVFKAAALSALVPGGGQYYVGNKRTAYYFFAAEALTWAGFASFTIYSNWKENDYILHASVHANARLDGKSDEFVDLVGFYSDIHEYNSLARAFDPERPYLMDTPENHWSWDSEDSRREYRHLKNRSREASRRAEFMIGVAVVDRIISIIDAVRATRKHNRQMPSEFSQDHSIQYKFGVHPYSTTRQFSFTVYPGFL